VLERFADAGDARPFVSVLMDWNGVSLSAPDKRGAARPGVYAVITSDPDEMRRTLREGEQ
jgi:hypothetical protein